MVPPRPDGAPEGGTCPFVGDPVAVASFVCVDLQKRWLTGQSARLEEYLDRFPSLRERADSVVDLLFFEYSLRETLGNAPNLTEYDQRFPTYAAALRERSALFSEFSTADGAANDSTPSPAAASGTLIQPRNVPLAGPASPRAPVGPSGPTDRSAAGGSDRYQVVRPHAKGGLGQVSVAVDRELGREVAFKEIQPHLATDPHNRQRFVREARVTGRLEHPGIVPVYGLGRRPDGQPFYAMRFIQGDSLKEATQIFHAGSSSKADRGTAFRKLLRRFIDVCNAVAFAHSKGVLHRDLKPANVMLGPFGETLVVDWGLAKELGEAEPAHGMSPAPADGNEHTGTGQAAGTPAYMSPEQAAGRWDDVGPQSDVYSLGASLYVLLTGQPAFTGDIFTVLAHVQAGTFPRPRDVQPDVPKALEAVCLTAMALKPADRYATPLLLAEDVERWLGDDPVTAYREPWTKRAARWARRHKTFVTSLTVLLVTGTTALAFSTVQISKARDKAEYRFGQAQAAVNDWLVGVTDDPRLKAEEDLQPLRRRLLGDGLKYYQDFLAERNSDPALGAANAGARLRVAMIQQEMGEADRAVMSYAEAFTLYDDLLARRPGDRGLMLESARGRLRFGNLQNAGADSRAAARESYQRALNLAEPFATDPGDTAAQKLQAQILTSLGQWHKDAKSTDAVAFCTRAIDLREKLLTTDAEDRAVRRALADDYINLAAIQQERRQLTAAKTSYERSRTVLAPLAEAGSAGREARAAEGRILHDLGILYEQLGRWKESAAARRESLAMRETLAYSRSLDYFSDLARTYNDLGMFEFKAGGTARNDKQKQDGLALVDQALALRQRLAAITGGSLRELSRLSESYSNTSNCLASVRKFAEAEDALRRGQEALDKVPADRRDTAEFAQQRGMNRHTLGFLYSQQNKLASARAAFEESRIVREKVLQLDPDHVQYLSDLAITYLMLGNVALRGGDGTGAVTAYRRACDLSDRLLKGGSDDVSGQMLHGVNTYSLANAQYRTGANVTDVAAAIEKAIAVERQAFEAVPDLREPRLALAAEYKTLSEVRRKEHKPAEAAAAASEMLKLWPDDPSWLFDAATALAQTAALEPEGGPDRKAYGEKAVEHVRRAIEQSTKDGRPDWPTEPFKLVDAASSLCQCMPLVPEAEQARFGDLALSALKRAVDLGYRNAARLKQPDFAPLKTRLEFEKLVTRAASPSTP
jgi:tetratricopeptide (TPR) repeat protein